MLVNELTLNDLFDAIKDEMPDVLDNSKELTNIDELILMIRMLYVNRFVTCQKLEQRLNIEIHDSIEDCAGMPDALDQVKENK